MRSCMSYTLTGSKGLYCRKKMNGLCFFYLSEFFPENTWYNICCVTHYFAHMMFDVLRFQFRLKAILHIPLLSCLLQISEVLIKYI